MLRRWEKRGGNGGDIDVALIGIGADKIERIIGFCIAVFIGGRKPYHTGKCLAVPGGGIISLAAHIEYNQ